MDQHIINLYDEYTHKPLKREEFIRRLVALTGSLTVALTFLPLLEVNYAYAATIPEDDPDLMVQSVSYPADGVTMNAYVARPKGKEKFGSVMVIHENRGLNPHTRDVTRRLAKAGFLAMAPDALSPFGGTPENEEGARELFSKIDPKQNLNNFIKGLAYLRARSESNGNTGCVGFCWGGALANQLAVNDPQLKAAVAYYGRQPDASDVVKIKAMVQLHYGSLDERINAGIPAYEAALKSAGATYELYIYEGAQHAFYNDTAPSRYNEAASKLAWERTLEILKKQLNG